MRSPLLAGHLLTATVVATSPLWVTPFLPGNSQKIAPLQFAQSAESSAPGDMSTRKKSGHAGSHDLDTPHRGANPQSPTHPMLPEAKPTPPTMAPAHPRSGTPGSGSGKGPGSGSGTGTGTGSTIPGPKSPSSPSSPSRPQTGSGKTPSSP